jgi:hypothetical protein
MSAASAFGALKMTDKAELVEYARPPKRRRGGDVVGAAYLAAVAAFPIGFLASIVALAAGDGRHGSDLPAELLFPYTMLSRLVLGHVATPAVLVALAQYPLYGAALGAAKEAGRLRRSFVCVLVLHGLATLACVLAFKFKFV